jgi:hypothetical protein
VGANRLERRRQKVRFLKIAITLVPEQISISRFFQSSVVVMGILTENFSPAAQMVFAWSALQNSYFLPLFLKPFFVKYTIVITHIDFFIENNFFGSLLLHDDRKKITKKRCKFLGPDVNFKFYQISNCPTFSAFI